MKKLSTLKDFVKEVETVQPSYYVFCEIGPEAEVCNREMSFFFVEYNPEPLVDCKYKFTDLFNGKQQLFPSGKMMIEFVDAHQDTVEIKPEIDNCYKVIKENQHGEVDSGETFFTDCLEEIKNQQC